MHADSTIKIFSKLYSRIENQWSKFIDEIKKNSDADD
jgi:hypothetical protein